MWSRALRPTILAYSSSRAEPGGSALELVAVDDPIRQPVLDGFRGGEVAIALHVLVDLRDRVARVMRVDLVDAAALGDDLARVDVDVGRLPLEAAGGLVDEDLRVRQGHALAVGASGQQQRTHRHRDPEADRLHLGLHVLHGVVDRETRVDRSTWGVDVKGDVLVGIVGLEMEDLRNDQVRYLLVDRLAEEDDSLAQQPGVDVVGALAARGLLDDHRDQRHRVLLRLVKCNRTVAYSSRYQKRNLEVANWRYREVHMDAERREVKRETVLRAPAGDVWEALTDERLLAEWLADEAELEPVPGGRASFRFADGEEREGTVLRVEEERELTFTWARPGEPETEVEMTLVPLVSGTRLVVVERASSTAPMALSGAAWGVRLAALDRAASLVLV